MKEQRFQILQHPDYSSYLITPSNYEIMKLSINILIFTINISQYI